MEKTLFSTFQLASLPLKNRFVMAPLTRSRAIGNVPNDLMARYYAQRASAGLIITEGTSPSPNGLGYARIPGLFTQDQVAGWRKTTSAVHQDAARIFIQLMHTGRVSHPANLPAGTEILAPSAIAAPGEMWTDSQAMQPHPMPKVMSEADIQKAIGEYVHAAKLAIEAGFDGVEIHAANGYLIDQFLNSASNHRNDAWGGSVENRVRFAVAIATQMAQAIGGNRVGIRISPYGVFNGMQPDPEMDALYLELIRQLNPLKLAYVHIVDHSSMGAPPVSAELKANIRRQFNGALILSGGYDLDRANADLAEGKGDLVAFGRGFISNPDLPQKFKTGAALKAANPDTFYTPGEAGYTDY
jgi:N-ethylmaleimide reductase